jgi:hypothetical protein
MTEWFKELASNLKAQEQTATAKRDRAKLLRRLAATEGPLLWNHVREAVGEAVQGFNEELPAGHKLRIASRDTPNQNQLNLKADARVVFVEAHFDEEGSSFIEYFAIPDGVKPPPAGRRILFMLSDDDLLLFGLSDKGAMSSLSPADVAKVLITSLFSS